MFAGSCIGVILFVMLLEALRRACIEYDGYLIHNKTEEAHIPAYLPDTMLESSSKKEAALFTPGRPSVPEHAIRSFLYMLQFAVGYFIMLLAMYYNGYFIICIFIGAFLGHFAFERRAMGSHIL
jgi:copper transporter 1